MKNFLVLVLFCFSVLFATETSQKEVRNVPLWSTFFHNIGYNTLGSFTYGYGIPLIAGAAGTYALIESGIDWKWNRFCVRHETLSNIGSLPGGIVGTFAPFAVPLAMYFGSDNPENQIAGLAMGQAALLGFGSTTFIKIWTGRIPPHVRDAADGDPEFQKDYSDGFRFGFMRGGVFNGWPSGHTATAVAMATTLATLYPENLPIRLGAIFYSIIIGTSMSFVAHWSSDIFAGALLGFAIGRTVGKSFAAFRDNTEAPKLTFSILPGYAGINYTF